MKKLTPINAIKAFCIECMGNQASLVEGCTAPECPLFKYRLGKNLRRSGVGNIRNTQKR